MKEIEWKLIIENIKRSWSKKIYILNRLGQSGIEIGRNGLKKGIIISLLGRRRCRTGRMIKEIGKL